MKNYRDFIAHIKLLHLYIYLYFFFYLGFFHDHSGVAELQGMGGGAGGEHFTNFSRILPTASETLRH